MYYTCPYLIKILKGLVIASFDHSDSVVCFPVCWRATLNDRRYRQLYIHVIEQASASDLRTPHLAL